MSQPPAYNKSTNFSDYATANPSAPFPAASTDSEFSAVETTLDAINTNLALIQRDDGLLKNGSVHPDSLSTATRVLISDWNPRGDWAAATVYALKDVVEEDGVWYVCIVAHTAVNFATDLAAARWMAINLDMAGLADTDNPLLGDNLLGVKLDATGAVARTQHEVNEETVSILAFCTPTQRASIIARNLAVDVTSAILLAIESFRIAGRGVAATDPEFGAGTCYVGGTIEFPDGLYAVSYDQLEIDDVFALRFRGKGARNASNFQRGATEIVFFGTSSGYGIRCKTNLARNFLIEDMSVTYQGTGFTGTLIDCWSSPGFNHHRTYFGHDGLTAPTRATTAANIVQLTANEFYAPSNSWMSGATDGVYFYTARSTTSFGSAGVDLSGLRFYDFTGSHVATDGTYAISGLRIAGAYFDPITVQPQRALRLRKVNGLVIDGNMFNGANSSVQPSVEWMSIVDCQGKIGGNLYGDRAQPGTLAGGALDVSGNYIFNSTGDGFRLMGGIISARANQFADANAGWRIFPTLTVSGAANNGSGLIRITSTAHKLATGMIVTIASVGGTTEANGNWTVTEIGADTFDLQGSTFTNAYTSGGTIVSQEPLVIDLGPDRFTSSCTNSYVIGTETNSIHGRINYNEDLDGSASKFSVAETSNGRVKIENLDRRVITSSAASLTISDTDTGRIIAATNSSGNAQTITLPTATPGTSITIQKRGTGELTIQRAGSQVIDVGRTATATSISNITTETGAQITLRAVATTLWTIDSVVGNWNNIPGSFLTGSATFNPADLADGAGETTTVTVTGAALGDFAEASFSLDVQSLTVTAWVSATDTVSVRFQNEAGAGNINLGSGTLRARVRKV